MQAWADDVFTFARRQTDLMPAWPSPATYAVSLQDPDAEGRIRHHLAEFQLEQSTSATSLLITLMIYVDDSNVSVEQLMSLCQTAPGPLMVIAITRWIRRLSSDLRADSVSAIVDCLQTVVKIARQQALQGSKSELNAVFQGVALILKELNSSTLQHDVNISVCNSLCRLSDDALDRNDDPLLRFVWQGLSTNTLFGCGSIISYLLDKILNQQPHCNTRSIKVMAFLANQLRLSLQSSTGSQSHDSCKLIQSKLSLIFEPISVAVLQSQFSLTLIFKLLEILADIADHCSFSFAQLPEKNRFYRLIIMSVTLMQKGCPLSGLPECFTLLCQAFQHLTDDIYNFFISVISRCMSNKSESIREVFRNVFNENVFTFRICRHLIVRYICFSSASTRSALLDQLQKTSEELFNRSTELTFYQVRLCDVVIAVFRSMPDPGPFLQFLKAMFQPVLDHKLAPGTNSSSICYAHSYLLRFLSLDAFPDDRSRCGFARQILNFFSRITSLPNAKTPDLLLAFEGLYFVLQSKPVVDTLCDNAFRSTIVNGIQARLKHPILSSRLLSTISKCIAAMAILVPSNQLSSILQSLRSQKLICMATVSLITACKREEQHTVLDLAAQYCNRRNSVVQMLILYAAESGHRFSLPSPNPEMSSLLNRAKHARDSNELELVIRDAWTEARCSANMYIEECFKNLDHLLTRSQSSRELCVLLPRLETIRHHLSDINTT